MIPVLNINQMYTIKVGHLLSNLHRNCGVEFACRILLSKLSNVDRIRVPTVDDQA